MLELGSCSFTISSATAARRQTAVGAKQSCLSVFLFAVCSLFPAGETEPYSLLWLCANKRFALLLIVAVQVAQDARRHHAQC
jgi:hypothetical protein